MGGCDDIKALQASKELDALIADLIFREQESAQGQQRLESIKEARKPRGEAIQVSCFAPLSR